MIEETSTKFEDGQYVYQRGSRPLFMPVFKDSETEQKVLQEWYQGVENYLRAT
jgi:hypothetical protein